MWSNYVSTLVLRQKWTITVIVCYAKGKGRTIQTKLDQADPVRSAASKSAIQYRSHTDSDLPWKYMSISKWKRKTLHKWCGARNSAVSGWHWLLLAVNQSRTSAASAVYWTPTRVGANSEIVKFTTQLVLMLTQTILLTLTLTLTLLLTLTNPNPNTNPVGRKSDGMTGQMTGHLEVNMPPATVPSLSTCNGRTTGHWPMALFKRRDRWDTFNCPSLCGSSSRF